MLGVLELEQVNPKRVMLFVVAACLIGMVVGSAVTFAVLQRNYSIPTAGMVIGVNVGVFADSACTQNLTSISWGSVYPGESVSRTAYVKNTGNAPITLSMTTAGWNPAAANGPISIAWDRGSVSLTSGQVVVATITLSVSPSISGITDFNVTIVITGSG
jgi:hypothetical protein